MKKLSLVLLAFAGSLISSNAATNYAAQVISYNPGVGFASGFTNSLMAKDVGLYLREVQAQDGPTSFGELTASVWQEFADQEPGTDFTRIYPFVSGR